MRILPGVAFLAFVVISAAWLAHDSHHHGDYPPGCSLDFSPSGLSLAYSYLEHPGGHAVRRLTSPLQHATVDTAAVVMRISPLYDPFLEQMHASETGEQSTQIKTRALLSADEDLWVSAGGRLVIAASENYGSLQVSAAAWDHRELRKVFPALAGVDKISFARVLNGPALATTCTVFALGEHPTIVRMAHGQGEVWLLSCPEAFDNRDLDNGEHLPLLIALTSDRHEVVFDEFTHGVSDENGLMHLLRLAHFGPAMGLMVLSCGCWFWRRRVLIGQVSRHPAPPAIEAVDGVAAIGALYARVLSRREALKAHYQRLLRKLQEQHRGNAASAQAECDRLLNQWRPESLISEPSVSSFLALLRRLNRALRSLQHDHHLRRP